MVPKTCRFNSSVRSFSSLKLKSQFLRSEFHGKKVAFCVNRAIPNRVNSQFSASTGPKNRESFVTGNKYAIIYKFPSQVQKWWEKGIQPNTTEVTSGDKLVVVDFFSPGCGGCKALHPKDLKDDFAEHVKICGFTGLVLKGPSARIHCKILIRKPKKNTTKLGKKWRTFCKDNELKAGNKLRFDFVSTKINIVKVIKL